jgi:hypothetical protein
MEGREREVQKHLETASLSIYQKILSIFGKYMRDLLLKLPRENNISIDDQINNLLPRLLSLFLFL